MSKAARSRRKRNTFADKLRQQLWLVIPLGVVVLVVALGIINGRRERPGIVESFLINSPGVPLPPQPDRASLPGEAIPILESPHIPEGEKATFNSNPPTSGAHYAIPAPWGIHNQAPLDEALVHNLEHGGIIISYDPAQIQGQVLEDLRTQTRAELTRVLFSHPEKISIPRSLSPLGAIYRS